MKFLIVFLIYANTALCATSNIILPGGDGGITQLTGDVTAGPGDGSQAATIANSAVTNAKMANMASHTVKSNVTGGSAAPSDNSVSSILDASLGSAQGDLIVRGALTWGALPGDATGYVLTSTGPTSAPAWAPAAGGGATGNIGVLATSKAGYGSTASKVEYFNTATNSGSYTTITNNNSTNGMAVTINHAGVYETGVCDLSTTTCQTGISVSASSLTTSYNGLAVGEQVVGGNIGGDSPKCFTKSQYFAVNAIVRSQGDGGCNDTGDDREKFWVLYLRD